MDQVQHSELHFTPLMNWCEAPTWRPAAIERRAPRVARYRRQASPQAPAQSALSFESAVALEKAVARDSEVAESIAKSPKLSVAERRRAESELLTQYTPLVQQIAGGFQKKLPSSVQRDDLVAAGMSGLWDAVRKQVAEPNERFECYVRMRIRGAILDELRAQDWLSRRARAAAAQAETEGRVGRSVAPSVVRFDDVSEWEQSRCLSTGSQFNAELELTAKSEREFLARALQELPSRERHIVASHYFNGVRFKDLGEELGVSEPRISQLHSRAMKLLRDLLAQAA